LEQNTVPPRVHKPEIREKILEMLRNEVGWTTLGRIQSCTGINIMVLKYTLPELALLGYVEAQPTPLGWIYKIKENKEVAACQIEK